MPKACFSGFSYSYAPRGSMGGGGHWKDGGDGGAGGHRQRGGGLQGGGGRARGSRIMPLDQTASYEVFEQNLKLK